VQAFGPGLQGGHPDVVGQGHVDRLHDPVEELLDDGGVQSQPGDRQFGVDEPDLLRWLVELRDG